MIKFHQLKKELHFPRMAGILRVKEDTALLHALLCHERQQSALSARQAINALTRAKEASHAARIAADWKMLDACYLEDINLLATYMIQEGIGMI